MRFKRSVRFIVQKPTTWFAMGVWHALTQIVARKPLIVTSGNDGKHAPNSKHYTDDAFDARVRHLTAEERQQIVARAREILVPLGYDVISADHHNPTLARQHQNHDHVEFDPKPGRELIKYTD